MAYTLTIECPGQQPTKLVYHDADAAKQAAWRMQRGAKACRIEVRSPNGTLVGRSKRKRGRRLGQAMTTKCVQRDRRTGECTEWLLYKRR
jgi:hypothetical protein